MKNLIFVLTLTLGMHATAQDQKPKFDINQKKTMVLSNLDQRIAILQSKKGCIGAATSKEAMKSCHQSHKEQMKALRAKFKDARKMARGN